MATNVITQPFAFFVDSKNSKGLENGKIYIGTENQNPETNPISVYWDSALTEVAQQPIRTIAGYPVRNGAATQFFTASKYSITVRDKNDNLIYSSLSEPKSNSVITDITYNLGATGAVNRALNSKLADFVTPEDFGAAGDGSTDDTAEFQAALNYAATTENKVLWCQGKYLCTSAISTTLTNDFMIGGRGTVLGSTADITLFTINPAGFNVVIDGLTVDCGTACSRGLQIDQTTQGTNRAVLNNVVVKNVYRASTGDAIGLLVRGGWKSVTLTNSEVRNVSKGIGISGGTGGAYLVNVSGVWPQSINVSNCNFVDVTNSETTASAQNQDADGLQVFALISTGTSYIDGSINVTNCYFRNCKGRGIKSQADAVNITNCNVYRDIAGINNGYGEINCQSVSGNVENCTFTYEDSASGEATLVREGSPISFYNGTDYGRHRIYNVDNCHVYDGTTGGNSISAMVTASSGYAPSTSNNNWILNVTKCNAIAKLNGFVIATPYPFGTSNPSFGQCNIENCSVKTLNYGVVGYSMGSGSHFKYNQVSIKNFRHFDTAVLPTYQTSATSTIASVKVFLDNTVKGVIQDDQTQQFTASPVSNLLGYDPDDTDATSSNGLRTYTKIINSASTSTGDTWTTPSSLTPFHGVMIISSTYGAGTNGVFLLDTTVGVQELPGSTKPSNVALDSDFTPGSDPNQNNMLNIWVDTTNYNVHFKNFLGSNREFVIVLIGM